MLAYIRPDIEIGAWVMELEDRKGNILTRMDFDSLLEAFDFADQKGYELMIRR